MYGDAIADLQNLTHFLSEKRYSESDIEGVFYRNWFRFLRRAWMRDFDSRFISIFIYLFMLLETKQLDNCFIIITFEKN
jgi:hypothetical protein